MPDNLDANRPAKTAAFFDVDGTLADTTIAHYFRYFMLQRLPPLLGRIWYAGFLARCGFYILLDKIDRGRLNTVFYRNYGGLPVADIKAMVEECHRQVLVPRQFAEAAECVEHHRAAGDLVVLVTGSLDFIIEPLARELGAGRVVAATLTERDGRFTGKLAGPPIGAGEKARRMRELAASDALDLSRSHAYGDSISDLPMLEAVGFPHAVNPDRGLTGIARARSWPIHLWTCPTGTARNGR